MLMDYMQLQERDDNHACHVNMYIIVANRIEGVYYCTICF